MDSSTWLMSHYCLHLSDESPLKCSYEMTVLLGHISFRPEQQGQCGVKEHRSETQSTLMVNLSLICCTSHTASLYLNSPLSFCLIYEIYKPSDLENVCY